MHPTTVTVFNCKFIGSSAETGGGGYTMGGEGNIILVETCMFEGKRIIHCWWSYCHCNLFFISIRDLLPLRWNCNIGYVVREKNVFMSNYGPALWVTLRPTNTQSIFISF